MQKVNDFQSLYLRRSVNRNKSEWAIVGFQLEMIADYIFQMSTKAISFKEILELINTLNFEDLKGPERGQKIQKTRKLLKENFESIDGLSKNLFKKRLTE